MKKQHLFSALALALSLSGAGCGKSHKSEWSNPPTQAVPTGPTELKLKWPAGGRLVYNLDVESLAELTVPNAPNPIKQDTTSGQKYSITVLNERTGGGHEVELEFLSTKMQVKADNRIEFKFDSTKKPSEDSKNPMAGGFRKLVGTRLRYLLDAGSQVELVMGVSDIEKRLSSEAQKDPSGTLKSMFNEDYWKQFMGGARALPAKPVQPGDTWPVLDDVVMGALGVVTLDQTYTFKSWEMHDQRNCARLEFVGTVTRNPNQGPPPSGMNFTIDDGKSSGVTWYDPERGVFVETTIAQTWKLNIIVPNRQGGGAAGASQTMTITGPVTVKVDVKLDSAE